MPTTPDDDRDPRGAVGAPDHVTPHLFDSELEHLAFRRPRTEAEREQAAAAAAELARRAVEQRSDDGEPGAGPPAASDDRGAAPSRVGAPALAPRDRARGAAARPALERPRRRWAAAAAVAATTVLALGIGASLLPSPPNADAGSSLAVFARAATVDEVDLRDRLLREGLRITSTPRVIASYEGDLLVAYRFVATVPDERSRNDVCLIVVAEGRALGAPSCVDRGDFTATGMRARVSGSTQRSVVQWGPSGSPIVSPLDDSTGAGVHPQSDAATALLTGEQSDADLGYADLLRPLHPNDRLVVRVLATTPRWDAVGALVASADTGLWSYCVHLFRPADALAPQVGASVSCAGLDAFERDGLVASARAAGSTLVVEWRPDDTVTVDEMTP